MFKFSLEGDIHMGMLRPVLFLLILLFPFFVINWHASRQIEKNKIRNYSKFYYMLFLLLYVLFVLWAAEVFNI